MINEKQVKELLNQIVDEERDEELDEQDLADSEAGAGQPKSGASDDQGTGADGYPSSTTKWEDVRSPIQRGVANPKDYSKKRHVDYPESEPTRGVGNQLQ